MQTFIYCLHDCLGYESPIRMLDQYLLKYIKAMLPTSIYIHVAFSYVESKMGNEYIEFDNEGLFSYTKEPILNPIHVEHKECVRAQPGIYHYTYGVYKMGPWKTADDAISSGFPEDNESKLRRSLSTSLEKTYDPIIYYHDYTSLSYRSACTNNYVVQKVVLNDVIDNLDTLTAVYDTDDQEVMSVGIFQPMEHTHYMYQTLQYITLNRC